MKLIILAVLVLLVVGWYLFRPERIFIDSKVNESLPEASETSQALGDTQTRSPTVLFEGEFHGVAHDGNGTAQVYKLGDNKRVLRFTNFKVSNGPDVVVYLVALDDAIDSKTVKDAEFVMLGELKGNVGDQNYDIPEEVDLNKYRAVTIWCRRFGVNFATAPLKGI